MATQVTMLRAQDIIKEDPLIRKNFNAHQLSFLAYLGFIRYRKLTRHAHYCLEDVRAMAEFKMQRSKQAR